MKKNQIMLNGLNITKSYSLLSKFAVLKQSSKLDSILTIVQKSINLIKC
jgi:hypothetical protein